MISDIELESPNEGQQQFFNVLTQVLQYEKGFSSTDGGPGFSRLIFLRGCGGTGKSHCVNAVRNSLDACQEAVMATTGKAATVIGGSTVFSKKMVLPFQQVKYLTSCHLVLFLEDYKTNLNMYL